MAHDDDIENNRPPKKDRDLRLRQALRENLRRRKQPAQVDERTEKGQRRRDSIGRREGSFSGKDTTTD
jgi:hypothetical protein